MVAIDEVARILKKLHEWDNPYKRETEARIWQAIGKPIVGEAHAEEAKRNMLNDSEYKALAKRFREALNREHDGEMNKILNGFLEHSNHFGSAWLPSPKFRYDSVLSIILNHYKLIKDYHEGRFYVSDKKAANSQISRINTIKKSIEIAILYNNKAFEKEAKNMIKMLEKEERITMEKIARHTFYHLFRVLNSPDISDNNFKLSEMKAAGTAQQLMQNLIDEDIKRYSPTKQAEETRFYNVSDEDERVLTYFK